MRNIQKLRLQITLWLTIVITGVWADTVDSLTVADQTADSIPDQVKMGDGRMVTARRLPKRAPSVSTT